MNDDTPKAILAKIVAVIEEHTTTLLSHRENFEHLLKEVGEIKKRLEKLEKNYALECNDAKFVAEVNDRLKAILTSLDKES